MLRSQSQVTWQHRAVEKKTVNQQQYKFDASYNNQYCTYFEASKWFTDFSQQFEPQTT